MLKVTEHNKEKLMEALKREGFKPAGVNCPNCVEPCEMYQKSEPALAVS